MTETAQYTDNDLIARYIALRDKKAALKKEFEKSVEPYDEAMTAIEGTMSMRLNERGAKAATTDSGTAFKNTLTKVRVADPASFLAYVRANDAYSLLKVGVEEGEARDFMEKHHGVPPPGVDVTQIVDVKFRKPT